MSKVHRGCASRPREVREGQSPEVKAPAGGQEGGDRPSPTPPPSPGNGSFPYLRAGFPNVSPLVARQASRPGNPQRSGRASEMACSPTCQVKKKSPVKENRQ